MKKTNFLLFGILSLLSLASCGANNQTQNTTNNTNPTNGFESNAGTQTPISTHEIVLTDKNMTQHIDYTIGWQTTSSYEYSEEYGGSTYVYTTTLNIKIKQARQGFVEYDGTTEIFFSFEWEYSKDNATLKNSTFVTVPLTLSKTIHETSFTKEYVGISKKNEPLGSKIPILNYNITPWIKKVAADKTNMKATYYNCGISGDGSLSYKSYAITIANYSYYLTVGPNLNGSTVKAHTQGSYVCPINPNEMFDYRINMTVGGENVTLTKDGYYFFDEVLKDLTITNVEGYIDVYPGRVI